MVTRCDDKITDLTDITHCILMDYAEQWGCDFVTLETREEWMIDYELAHYRILRVKELLQVYERVLVIDSDIVIMPGCPNPFEEVPVDKIGTIYEDKGSREAMRQGVIMSIQERFGDVGWESGYINTGFFVVSRQHANIFQAIKGQHWTGFGFDDPLIGYNIHKFNHEIHELSFKWNHMSMFSEDWNGNANRFDSHIIHYAGLARFPDDRSGRNITGNNMNERLELIKNDIDRITDGLMTFESVRLTEIQGHGSRTYEAKVGVQERPVILKVPNTEECLKRELKVLACNIPGTVQFLGLGDNDIGKFIMLEKLYSLPDEFPEAFMLTVATDVLITMRQLWKLGIPWICKLEHIMISMDGSIKLIDFGDDEYHHLPFYGNTDECEAIIMYGDCDEDGRYIDRSITPLSGYVACMKYLCEKNGIGMEVLYEAELNMITYEYQALKDVHQPIWLEPYTHILRTESEEDDPKFGELVPANRKCHDRADMIYENIEPWMTDKTTWLDIGCNVGWFVFEFAPHFLMSGVDFDKEKIAFATMMAQGERVGCGFGHMDVNVETVQRMPEYDVISVLSMLHLQLVKDRDQLKFWALFKAISDKARKCLFFEFPQHCYEHLLLLQNTPENFAENVKIIGGFESVEIIGTTDANRPMFKCLKEKSDA
jgi:hypothetical protein